MAGASLMPDYYKSRVNLAVLLAPPASMYYNPTTGLHTASKAPIVNFVLGFLDTIKFWNIMPFNWAASKAVQPICKLFDGAICNLFAGSSDTLFDPTIDDATRFSAFVTHLPSGASAYNYVHYAQLTQYGKPCFKRYDMGSDQANIKAYGQKTPPDYNLGAIDFPIAIFSGAIDGLADAADVAWTVE